MEKEPYIFYDRDRNPGDPSLRQKRYVDSNTAPPVQKYALGLYAVGEETFAPGSAMENGETNYYECSLVTAGELFFRCGNVKKLLHAGELFLARPGQNFFLENRGKGTAVRKHAVIHSGPVAGLLLDHGILAETFFPFLAEPERVEKLLSSLMEACGKNDVLAPHAVSTLCYSLLTEISRQSEWHDKSSEFKRITFLMARLPARRYTVPSLAEDCKVSVRTLYNLFMREKNCSPMEYLIRERMKLAEWYLSREDLAVSDVANLCGYRNVPFFTRVFKARNGMTPAAFARLRRNGKK